MTSAQFRIIDSSARQRYTASLPPCKYLHMFQELVERAQQHAFPCESVDDPAIALEAARWAKLIRNEVAKIVVDLTKTPKEDSPTSIFMAGTPGAGKTEWRTNFFDTFPIPIVQIDPDDFRCLLPCYNGNNSHLFQGGTSLITERVLDRAFEKKVSFVLDGTFSHWGVASKNIRRSLDRNRIVQIYFVHQNPLNSWNFVGAREKVEGRRITADAFIASFFGTKDVIRRLLTDDEFSDALAKKRLTIDALIRPNGSLKAFSWKHRITANEFKGIVSTDYTAKELRAMIEGQSSVDDPRRST